MRKLKNITKKVITFIIFRITLKITSRALLLMGLILMCLGGCLSIVTLKMENMIARILS